MKAFEKLFTLFQNISLKTNSDKCHLLLRDTGCQVIDVCHKRIENLRCEKQLERVTYRFLYAKRHNDALEWGQGGGEGVITNDVLKFRKIIEFQSS